MRRTKEEIQQDFEKFKEMFEHGYSIREIAVAYNTHRGIVLDTFTLMGYSRKKEETENLVYADNKVEIKKVVINGKKYTDLTEIYAPK